MPRQKRADEGGAIYHALNRGNARQRIFHKDDDYEAFLRVLSEGLQRYAVDVFALVLMPNHWHLVLRPSEDGLMGRMLRWVTATHTQRYHAHSKTAGQGHLYQSRFKSFPVADDHHFLIVCRYVERNPLRARFVQRAEDWQFSSLRLWGQAGQSLPKLLSPWPTPRTPNWIECVNQPLRDEELKTLRECVVRGRPYGDESRTKHVAQRAGLSHKLRPRGRPRKQQARPKK